MVKKTRPYILVVLVITVVFLFCIASSSAAITEKNVKNLNKPDNKFQSVNNQVSKNDVGLMLFDGIAIVQNESVIVRAHQNMTLIENLHSEYSEQMNYHNWSLRQYADYVADPSHSINYWITTTQGMWMSASNGTLGYSGATDQIIGEKYNYYNFKLNDVLSEVVDIRNYHPSQWRLTIYPDDNRLLIQDYGYGDTSPTPEEEYMVSLTQMADGRYGGAIGERSYLVIFLLPDPDPGSNN